jgi:hypothetical protein
LAKLARGELRMQTWLLGVQLRRVSGEIEDGLVKRSEHVQQLFAQLLNGRAGRRYRVGGVAEFWPILGGVEFTNLEPFTVQLRGAGRAGDDIAPDTRCAWSCTGGTSSRRAEMFTVVVFFGLAFVVEDEAQLGSKLAEWACLFVLSVTNDVRDFVLLSALLCDELFMPELRTPFDGCFSVNVGAVSRAAPHSGTPTEREVGRFSAGTAFTPASSASASLMQRHVPILRELHGLPLTVCGVHARRGP